MTNENKKRYPDEIREMLLEDPYQPLHVWNISRNKHYLETLKQSTGIEHKKGHWSAKEIKQLEDNLKLYQSLNPNVPIFKLIYEQKNKNKSKIFNETRFWDLISYNLCRQMKNIEVSVNHHFMQEAGYKAGPYSKQEYGILKELVKKHGKNWSLISNLVNRCATNLSIVYNQSIKNNINSGPWHKEEKDKFFCITNQLIHYNQQNQLPLFKISLRVVSDFIQTRSLDACRNFLRMNKLMLENIFMSSIMKEAMILYTYFSINQLAIESKKKELLLLFNGKYSENDLQKEYNNIISVLPNGDIKDGIRSEYSELIQQSESLFKRINFENVVQTMVNRRTVAWLKTKYYILVSENIENFKEKTSEEIISMLHDKYCTTELVNKDNLEQNLDPEEESITKQKFNSSIDLTFLSDDDYINNISDDDDYNDFTHLSDDLDIADVSEGDAVIVID